MDKLIACKNCRFWEVLLYTNPASFCSKLSGVSTGPRVGILRPGEYPDQKKPFNSGNAVYTTKDFGCIHHKLRD